MKSFSEHTKTNRLANIELLRLLSMAGVIILHYNNKDIGGGLAYVSAGSLNQLLLFFLESLNICAVNLFMILSGYFLSQNNKRSLGRGLSLVIQVIIFRLSFLFCKAIINKELFSIRSFIHALLPCNYFVILYVVVYLISPLINRAIICIHGNKDEKKELNFSSILLFVLFLFSLWPTIVDILIEVSGNDLSGLSSIGMYGSGRGYTIINFILSYLLGAYIANNKTASSKNIIHWKTRYLILSLFGCVSILTLWGYINPSTAYEYCNPLVLFEAFIIFVLFLRIKIKSSFCSSVINNISRCSFTVYLIHAPLLSFFMIKEYCNSNIFIMILHIFISIIIITIVGYIVDLIYRGVVGYWINKMRKLGSYNIYNK